MLDKASKYLKLEEERLFQRIVRSSENAKVPGSTSIVIPQTSLSHRSSMIVADKQLQRVSLIERIPLLVIS
jgi:hypothetical protein